MRDSGVITGITHFGEDRRPTVVDLACGHGLAGVLFAVLERDVVKQVLLLDTRQPKSFDSIMRAVATVAPWAVARVSRQKCKGVDDSLVSQQIQFLAVDLLRLEEGLMAAAAGENTASREHQRDDSVRDGFSSTASSLITESEAESERRKEKLHIALNLLRSAAGWTAQQEPSVSHISREDGDQKATRGDRPAEKGCGFVSLHACGGLTDAALSVAARLRSPIAVMVRVRFLQRRECSSLSVLRR